MAMTIDTTSFDGPLGAKVTGIDLARPVDAESAEQLRQAWGENLLLVFPGQSMDIRSAIISFDISGTGR